MKKQIITLSTLAGSAITYFSLALPTFAQGGGAVNPCDFSNTGGGTNFNPLCQLQANNIGTVISSAVTIALIAAAIISLFFLIFGGIRWVTSGGDKAKVESARNTIIAAIIGLIIALLAFFIITIVLGLFGLSLNNLTLPKITK
jgi:amino acid transporter